MYIYMGCRLRRSCGNVVNSAFRILLISGLSGC
nr:MAG TPA: hypothetical protein [Inoviridae sp.]